MSGQADLRNVAISSIRENPVALRGVNKETEEYVGLRDSIGSAGILNPISVRAKVDPATQAEYFEICDGLHRYSCALDVGLETIPVNVVSLTESQTLEAQVMANVHKIETKPVEYTKQLQRIVAANPTMTLAELATRLCKSPAWLNQRFGLLKLEPGIAKLVDDNKINLSNAYALAKLPSNEQLNFIDSAMTMAPAEFVPTVNARVKELRDAARQGRDATKAEFTAVPFLRKLADIKAEHEHASVGPQLVAETGAATAVDGFALGVAWVVNMDPQSVAAQAAKAEARRLKQESERKARVVERADKRAAEAATAQAKARADAGLEEVGA